MTADEIIDAARLAIGTPFQHQGRSPWKALDCAGLIVHVAREVGIEYVDQAGYSRLPSGGMLEAALDRQPGLRQVPVSERKPGDVLLMRFKNEPQHLAIYAGDTIIHSYAAVRQVCEHRLDDAWLARIVGVYRFKGLA